MSIRLGHVPTLTERIVGANLIVIGRVNGLRETRPAEGFDRAREFGLFEVEVDEVWYGESPDRLIVRVLSDPDDRAAEGEPTRWIMPVDFGATVVLLLARDVAPELPDDVYAPYFASTFSVEDDERVAVPGDILDRPTRATGDRVSLADLRGLVHSITAERDERQRSMERLLPAHLKQNPYPLVLEQPGVEQPSGRQASEIAAGGGIHGQEQPD